MKIIQFTLGDSDKWYEIDADFELYNELQTGRVVEFHINEGLKSRKIRGVPKRVKVFDEDGTMLASSSDICYVEKLEFESKKQK